MNLNEATKLIHAADLCGHVPLLIGTHGLGKSTAIGQYADSQNLHLSTLILSLMEEGDLSGLPTNREVGGLLATDWAAPSWYQEIVNLAWPTKLKIDQLDFNDADLSFAVHNSLSANQQTISRDKLNEIYCAHYSLPNHQLQILRQNNVHYLEGKRSVLFLDELNRTHSSILNVSLQLVLDKRIHNHILPTVCGRDTLVVAAINPSNGNYTVSEFDPALLDRFVVTNVEPDTKSWLAWASEAKLNQYVIDFIAKNPSKLHVEDKHGGKGASPRSWTRLAIYLDKLKNTDESIMSYYVQGTIGQALTAEFLIFYKNYVKTLSVEDVVKAANNKKTKPIEEVGRSLEKLLEPLESVQRLQLAKDLESLLDEDNLDKQRPYLAYLYALPLENLAGYVKDLKYDRKQMFEKLLTLDTHFNNKQLLVRIVKQSQQQGN